MCFVNDPVMLLISEVSHSHIGHLIVGMSIIRFVKTNCERPISLSEKKEYRKLINRGEKIINAVNSKYNDIALDCRISLQDKDENIKWIQENLFKE
jgi:hypothetical protein